MRDRSGSEDSTALPSWRGLLFGVLALGGVSLLAALILSNRLERRGEPPLPSAPAARAPNPATLEPPPEPLQPSPAWAPASGLIADAQAISALMLALDAKWVEADRHVRAMYQVPVTGDATTARARNATGLSHIRAGDYASAIKAFDSASQADSGDVEVANNLGYAYVKGGRAREGVPALLRALHLSPLRSSAWINLSEALAASGHDDASLAALLLALRYTARREETREFLGDASRNHGSEAFRRQAGRALKRIDSVPSLPAGVSSK